MNTRPDHVQTETDRITAWITLHLPELNPAQVKMLARYVLEQKDESYYRGARLTKEGTA